MNKIFFISLLLSVVLSTSCKDDNVPGIDRTAVSQEKILGGWDVSETKFYVNVALVAKPLAEAAGLYGLLDKKLADEAAGVAFYFEKEKVYLYRDGNLRDSSSYTLDAYKIYLDNPEFIGFYAPYFYIKFDKETFVTYLRRSESIELIEKDGYVDKAYIDLIKKNVEDAQCELRWRRNTTIQR